MQRVPCALIIALLLALAGCIVLPVPMPPRGTQVDVEAAKMVIGETTRAEVQALLGSPNRLAFGHREVWELDRDPAHMVFVIVAGGPGAAFVGGTRTGEAGVRRYVVEVAYDEAGLVQGWQWMAADGSGTASDGASSAAPAARPEKLLPLRADRVFFEARDRALVVDLAEPGSIVVERIEVATGARLESWRGPDKACRTGIALRPGRALQLERLDDGFLGVPVMVGRHAVPCRWQVAGAGRLEADILWDMAVPGTFLAARLAGDMVLREDPDNGVAVFGADGARLATLPLNARLTAVAADAAGTRLIVQTRSGSGADASYWLVERPLFEAQPLRQLAPLGVDETCRRTAPAMAPDGRRVAFACAAHVQIWRLGETAAETGLKRLLLLPGGGAMAALAFSSDGARLVAGHAGIAVWRTADWALESLLPAADAGAHWLVDGLWLSPDGSRMATSAGIWQLVPDAPEPQTAAP
jgi:hypothetical protein